jgi:iron complex outermembrane receptor protein
MKILWIWLLLTAGTVGSVHPADSAQAADTLHYLLPEVTVQAPRDRQIDRISSLPVVEISRSYLLKNNATNFVQTLASVPGIASMDIGAGFSKPVIRGLGFNRVAVVDRGIVQQNQQWGADHGLEIDQYDVDNVRVHKGPMSLFFGSDAIGGVIEILPPNVPENNMFWGDATLIGKSNNDLLGASVMASRKSGNLFYRARATVQSYADYRIPTDTIEYLTWRMPVHGRRMKNTAGREVDLSLSVNYAHEQFDGWLHVSDIFGKNGYFPGAHGIPLLSRLEPDGSVRNVEMPYAASNHFKLISNSAWQLSAASRLNLDLGFQQNHREELSPFHTHYSNQQPPLADPDLELRFRLQTFSGNVRLLRDEDKRWSKTFGLSAEAQHNRVGGYSFLLPGFERFSAGAYWLNQVKVTENFLLTGGVRYDAGRMRVDGYADPVLAEYLAMQGYSLEEAAFYAQRSVDLHSSFSDFSGSLGFAFSPGEHHSLKMNVGKSFRYPGANELASNGLHHGAFRHEQGNSGLTSEKGYQLDLDYRFTGRKFRLTLNPFMGWFSNYIYLEPSGTWSILPHAGQIYRYRQAEAIMAGGEVIAELELDERWSVTSDLEYVYNRNLTDHYPLPFSPPTVVTTDLTYSGAGQEVVSNYAFGLENQWVMEQNRIAKNEERTPGTSLWNLSAQLHWRLGGRRVITDFQVQNLMDRPFLNHLSFYRKLNTPEPGRNMQLIVKIPF